MIEMSGKVVLVTGGSRGIGACAARTLARAGAQVILSYVRSAEQARALAAEAGGGSCHSLQADFAEPGAATALWHEAVAWTGHVDVLVNNAGIYTSCPLESTLAEWHELWRETLQVNLIAAADLCREAIGHFQGRDGGIIINVASRAAFRGDAVEHMHYGASKGGLVALTRSIARHYAPQNILAYTVSPGFTRTDMAQRFIAAHGEGAAASDIPMGEIADPEDVGNVIVFLASGLARHATGTNIDINGASYMH